MADVRLKNLKTFKVYKWQTTTDDEGGTYTDYSAEPIECDLEVWPAGGKLQAEMYGERLAYMYNANCYYGTDIAEKDGVAINSADKPDYKVVSDRGYTGHRVLLLEAIRK